MAKHEEIAILMATYNSERFLSEQIDSLLAQTNKDWHLYIHDDGSIDKTLEILIKYQTANPSQITLLDYPRQGNAYANFMSMLSRIEAPYYMFCDHDDVWYPNKVQKTLDAYKNQKALTPKHPVIVHSDLCVVDEKLSLISQSFWQMARIHPQMFSKPGSRISNIVTGCTMFFDYDARQYALARKPYGNPLHDEWVTICSCAQGGIVVPIFDQLIAYRQHGNNTLGAEACCPPKDLKFYFANIMKLFNENINNYKTLQSAGYGSPLKYIFHKTINFIYYHLKF